jgi:hypothetical protein
VAGVAAAGEALLSPVRALVADHPEAAEGAKEFHSYGELTAAGDWGIPEEQVFVHALGSVREDGRAYELRIGKGSQIYSIRTPAGELIGPQRLHSAEWVDEVLQTVSVNRARNDRSHTFLFKEVDGRRVRVPQKPEAYFIHQAGTYNRDLAHPGTFYSPLLAGAAGPDGRGFSTLVWPQQAHIPNNHRSEMLIYQHVRWVEPGVFEVTNILHNYGEIELDRNNLPWVGLARVALPHAFLVEQGGDWRALEHFWGAGRKVGQFPIEKSGGAVVFASGLDDTDEALALIFGNDDRTSRPFRGRRLQLGGATFLQTGATVGRGDHDLQVATVISHIPIRQHQSLAVRYFVALGKRAEIDQAVARYAGQCYRKHVDLSSHAAELGRLGLATGPDGQPVARLVPDGGQGIPLRAAPFRGSRPLFLLRDNTDGSLRISTDPYALSASPQDHRTGYQGLLGFLDPGTVKIPLDTPVHINWYY